MKGRQHSSMQTIQKQSYKFKVRGKSKGGVPSRLESRKASWKRGIMHSFEAGTMPDHRGSGLDSKTHGTRALTVWCMHRVREVPAFFLWKSPARCKYMAATFLNMPPRALGNW